MKTRRYSAGLGQRPASTDPAPLKVAVLATHPIQYHAPVWRKLASLPEVVLKVFYGTDMSVRGYRDEGFGVTFAWDTPLLSGYDSEFLSTDPAIQQIGFLSPRARGIKQALQLFRPDVGLMVGYRNLFHIDSWRALRRLRIPIVMRHEATDVAHARSGVKALVRDSLLRGFYSTVSAFGVIGSEARQHLVRLGVCEDKLFPTPYCVDTDAIASQVSRWLPCRDALRAQHGIHGDATVFVFSGKLIEKKNPLLILHAMGQLAAEDPLVASKVHLVVAGDGPLMTHLREMTTPRLKNQVHLIGFLNQTELGKAYAMADSLILPSRRGSGETWGLVVNEAMQFGLPAIVSDGVGCGPDLILSGSTGWIFQSGDPNSLAAVMRKYVMLKSSERLRMRVAVLDRIAGYSLNVVVEGLRDALQTAVGR